MEVVASGLVAFSVDAAEALERAAGLVGRAGVVIVDEVELGAAAVDVVVDVGTAVTVAGVAPLRSQGFGGEGIMK